jgi:hypothetical protein
MRVVEIEDVEDETQLERQIREGQTTMLTLSYVFINCERQDEDLVRPNVHENCRCLLEKVPNE